MQDAIKDIPLRLGHQIAVFITVSVFLACAVCAQDVQRQRECEAIFAAAVRAEQRDDTLEAELRYEECLELARRYRLTKTEAASLHRLAVLKARNKKFSESATLFRRALDIDPRNAVILRDFAQLYTERRDYGEAERLLKRALDADPNDPKILFNLGSIIATQRADRQMEGLRYLKLAVGEAEAYRELARIYRANGDHSRAEFAERKAQEAVEAGNDIAPIYAPRRADSPQLTPPAITNRVRQEIADSEVRADIERQLQQPRQTQQAPQTQLQHAATSPVVQRPPIPAPVSPVPAGTASVPSAFNSVPAETPPQLLTPLFDTATPPVHPQRSTMSIVRQLNSPTMASPASANQAQAAVRAIPGPGTPTPVVQPPAAQSSGTIDPFAPVPSAAPPSMGGTFTVPQPAHTPPPMEPVPTSSPPAATPANPTNFDVLRQQLNVPSIRVLPSGTITTGYSEPNLDNSLFQHHPGEGEQINFGADISVVASSASRHALEFVRKPPRIEQNTSPESSRTPPTEAEEQASVQSGEMPVIETAWSAESILPEHLPHAPPVRDVGVLQSPSATIVRRESPRGGSTSRDSTFQENVYSYVAHLHPERPGSVISNLETADLTSGNRYFVPGDAQNAMHFSMSNLPSGTYEEHSADATAAVVASVDSSSMLAAARRGESRVSDSLVPPPMVAALVDTPEHAETRRVESRVPDWLNPPAVVDTPAVLPVLAEARRVEPRVLASLNSPSDVTVPVASPVLAETRRVEPLVTLLPKPATVTIVPDEQFLVANDHSPPSVAASSVAEKELPKPLPADEAPIGFASTRKEGSTVATAEDSLPGFARSRR